MNKWIQSKQMNGFGMEVGMDRKQNRQMEVNYYSLTRRWSSLWCDDSQSTDRSAEHDFL